ncbi:MAG TPA: FAD-dependent monooxygenase [Thermoanaerobaculia bacterium]|jgi:2-polyprenyl-6-methoxyphenol hydroxylase-like FAD-dependent oxidoreductase
MPESPIPVLIAGGGTVGLSAAVCLAEQGVPAVVQSWRRASRLREDFQADPLPC